MPENSSESLLAYKLRHKGVEHKEMNPILHRLVFLTMTLCADLTKDKADVKKRVAYINRVSPDLTTLTFGAEASECEIWNGTEWVGFVAHYKPKPRFDDNGKVDGWQVVINADTVEAYWGLSTNASRKPFKKWFNDFNKRTLEMMERGW